LVVFHLLIIENARINMPGCEYNYMAKLKYFALL